MLSLLALLGLAHASDVLVPTFTPSTLSDFGPAERLTEETLQALVDRGVPFVAPSEIQRRAGAVADGCAEEKSCTDVLWRHFPPARLAIVGAVTWNEGLLEAKVRFYGPKDASPIEVMTSSFPEEDIPKFADQIAFFADEMLDLVPPVDAGAVAVAAEPRSPKRTDRAAVDSPPRYEAEKVEDLDQKPNDAVGQGPTRQAAGMLPRRVWQRYEQSGLTWRRFKERELIRAGSVVIELGGGALFGDLNRAYDVRVAVEQQPDLSMSEIGLYQADSFVTGTGWSAGVAVGYLPLWWLEVGVQGSLNVGKKELTTGWEQYIAGEGIEPYAESTQEFDPTLAFMAGIEPRLRFYTVPTGPVKPYVLTAANLRFYDGYVVPDLDTIKYPDRSGGLSAGMTLGGGLAFDAPGGFLAFLEVPWTYLFSPQPFKRDTPAIFDPPAARSQSNQVLAIRAGLGFRI